MTVGRAPDRAPVMADVARLAGVSHQTVSRVLNDGPSIRPQTRERVLRAVEQLGYRRNTAARALVTRRSGNIGVITVDTAHYGPATALLGVEQAARQVGYFVTVASPREVSTAGVRAALDHLLQQPVEGIVVVAPQAGLLEVLSGIPAHVPLVTVHGDLGAGVPSIGVDQVQGARLATRHLLSLGHRTVVHLAGPQRWMESDGRLRGWRQELEAAGAPVPDPLPGDWTAERGYQVGIELADRQDVTAVFAANDQMALGLLRGLHERGVTVPDRVAVVGFDDIPGSGFFVPPLTTVRQDFAELGRRCLGVLVSAIRDQAGQQEQDLLPLVPELVVRVSCGASSTSARLRPGVVA